VAGAQIKEFARVSGTGQVERELLQLLGVAIEVEADALFEPQDIGNQRRTLFVDLVPVQQPQQRDQQHQQQADRQLEDRQVPIGPLQRSRAPAAAPVFIGVGEGGFFHSASSYRSSLASG
jgi:hypothetical protein